MEFWENRLATEFNSGGFQLSVIASYSVGSIKYILRIEKPNWERVDYVMSLEGLKKLGELLLDLHSFVEERIQNNNMGNIKELLTAEKIGEYAKINKTMKIS